MGKDSIVLGSAFSATQHPAIRFLVESALRKVMSTKEADAPRGRDEWVAYLATSLMSDSETSHRAAIASLLASGVRSEELFDTYVPAAAHRLGELWVKDKVSFVDVTVAASRLQALFRGRPDGTGRVDGGAIPLGESVLMAIPAFEDHSLGAFVAADQLRRHGLWVHMAIGLTNQEFAGLLETRRFSLLGLSAGTWNTLEKLTEVVDYLRANLQHVPPIVIGGRVVKDPAKIIERTGADFAVRTAREAVEKCGLSTVRSALTAEELG